MVIGLKVNQDKMLKKWVRLLTLPLADLSSVPSHMEARAGRGLHILLHKGQEFVMHLCVSPRGDTPDATLYTDTTALRHLGDTPIQETAQAWLNAIFSALESVEKRSGWNDFLAWTTNQPSETLPGTFGFAETASSEDTLLVRITGSCNAACDFCSARGILPDLIEGEWLIREYLGQARERHFDKVSFTGGEPTLVQPLPGYLRIAKQLGFVRTELESNGLMLSQSDVTGRLVEAGLDSVVLSLHSSKPEIHDSMQRVKGAFDRVVLAAEVCLAAGVEITFNHVLTTENITTLEDYITFLADGFTVRPLRVLLSFCAPVGWACRSLELVPRLNDVAEVYARALEAGKRLGLHLSIPRTFGIPLCVLPDHLESFDEFNSKNIHASPARTHVEACHTCIYKTRCSGFWRAYLDLHGHEELGPLTK